MQVLTIRFITSSASFSAQNSIKGPSSYASQNSIESDMFALQPHKFVFFGAGSLLYHSVATLQQIIR